MRSPVTGGVVKLYTVDDALRLLEFLAERGEITVREVGAELRCSRSSAYRLVRTLADRQWLVETRFGAYELGARAAMLGLRAMNRAPVRDAALPWMRQLCGESEETVTLSILVGQERVCIEQIESSREVRMTVRLGQPYPLYAGASGKAILMSFDSEARADYFSATVLRRLTPNTVVDPEYLTRILREAARRGYVTAIAERDPDAFAVAAPIFGRSGVVGSLAICGPASRFDRADAKRFGELVRDATRSISSSLGWPGSRMEVVANA